MWKKLLIGAALAASLAACATQPQTPAASATPAQTAGCTTRQWTPGPNKDCTNVGSTYTDDQLRRTGVIGDTAQALRRLDPSIQLR